MALQAMLVHMAVYCGVCAQPLPYLWVGGANGRADFALLPQPNQHHPLRPCALRHHGLRVEAEGDAHVLLQLALGRGQDLLLLQSRHVVNGDDCAIGTLRHGEQLLVVAQRNGSDALAIHRAGDKPLGAAIHRLDADIVADRVQDGAIVGVVQVVLDVAAEAKGEPAGWKEQSTGC